jgi:hypothetical protein
MIGGMAQAVSSVVSAKRYGALNLKTKKALTAKTQRTQRKEKEKNRTKALEDCPHIGR